MYRFKITKTYRYYGYPQAETHYEIESEYFSAKIKHYGNQGWDVPQINCFRKCNGYFWSMRKFMKDFYNGKLEKYFDEIKLNESIVIEIEEQ